MTNGANITIVARQVLGLLNGRATVNAGPIAAREIASRLRIAPRSGVENQRREVRKLVAELREDGHRVCECNAGYWLARDAAEWAAYLEAVKAESRFTFVRERIVREAVVDKLAGQGSLFDNEPAADWAKR